MTEKIERLKSRYFWIHTGLLILSIVLILISAARGVLRSGSAQDAMIYEYIERPLFSYSLAVILMVILSDKMNVHYSRRLKLVLRIIVIMITVGYAAAAMGWCTGLISANGTVYHGINVIGPQFLFLAVGILSASLHLPGRNKI